MKDEGDRGPYDKRLMLPDTMARSPILEHRRKMTKGNGRDAAMLSALVLGFSHRYEGDMTGSAKRLLVVWPLRPICAIELRASEDMKRHANLSSRRIAHNFTIQGLAPPTTKSQRPARCDDDRYIPEMGVDRQIVRNDLVFCKLGLGDGSRSRLSSSQPRGVNPRRKRERHQ